MSEQPFTQTQGLEEGSSNPALYLWDAPTRVWFRWRPSEANTEGFSSHDITSGFTGKTGSAITAHLKLPASPLKLDHTSTFLSRPVCA